VWVGVKVSGLRLNVALLQAWELCPQSTRPYILADDRRSNFRNIAMIPNKSNCAIMLFKVLAFSILCLHYPIKTGNHPNWLSMPQWALCDNLLDNPWHPITIIRPSLWGDFPRLGHNSSATVRMRYPKFEQQLLPW